MKKALKLTLAIALMLSSTALFAQKFGRINSSEVVSQMAETKQMQTNMQAVAKDIEGNMEALSVEFNNLLQDYQKNYNTMSQSVREMKEQALQSVQQRREQYEQSAQQDYQKQYNEQLAPIIEKAKAAIDKVAKAGAFAVVFDISQPSLAYFDEAVLIDIAPEVRKELGITDAPAAPAAAAAAAPAAAKK